MRRLTVAFGLALAFGLVLTGCDSGPASTDTQSEPKATTAQQGAAAHAPGEKPGGGTDRATGNEVALALEPENPEEFVEIVQAAQEVEEEKEGARNELWGSLWRDLRFTPPDPNFRDKVAMWGVLVVDGERKKSFLTEPKKFQGPDTPQTYEEVPENLFPNPDGLTPGDEYIQGSELTGGERIPPIPRYFQGNAWYPQPDNWTPGSGSNINAAPANWRVNGVIDGIFSPAGGIGGMTDQTKAQLLLMPVAEPPDLDASATKGLPSTAGILIRYVPIDPQK